MPHYETKTFVPIKAMMISNSCQASLDNIRHYPPYITFAPIFSLSKWEALLLKNSNGHEDSQAIAAHIDSIKAQRIASFFYIPFLGALGDECFVRFDCAFSIPLDQQFIEALLAQRLSTLNQTAIFLLILKLSIHFSRLQEKEMRGF